MTRAQRFGLYDDEVLRDQAVGFGYFAWVARTEAARCRAAGSRDEAADLLVAAQTYLDEVLDIETELFQRVAEGDRASTIERPAPLSPPEPLIDTLFPGDKTL